MNSSSDGITAQVRMGHPKFFSELSPPAVIFQDSMDFNSHGVISKARLKIKLIFKGIAALHCVACSTLFL